MAGNSDKKQTVNPISFIGLMGAGCQVLGTLFFSETLPYNPFFSFYPGLIGSLCFMFSGIFWLAEILTQDKPPNISRWKHARNRFIQAFTNFDLHSELTLYTVAGLLAMAASTIAFIGIYVSAVALPFYWASNVLIILSCIGWGLGASPPPEKKTFSDTLNQVAAVAQVLAIGFMVAATYFISPVLSYSDLSCALFSGVAWLLSYCIPNAGRAKNNLDIAMVSLHNSLHREKRVIAVKENNAFRLHEIATHTERPYWLGGTSSRSRVLSEKPRHDASSAAAAPLKGGGATVVLSPLQRGGEYRGGAPL